MRLPFCPAACVPTRSPDVPEGVVGRFAPAASPVPVLVADAFCLAAELADGAVSPLLPLPVFGVAAAVCLGEAEGVCLGDAEVFGEAVGLVPVVRLAFLTGVVGFELRLWGVFLPDELGDDLGGVCPPGAWWWWWW